MICFIVVSPIAVVFSPFIGIWYSCKWLYKHLSKKKVEEVQPEIKSHVTPKPNYGRFLFKEDREVKIPIDKIVYVETSPDEAISTFLEEDKDWIRFWQEWYGIDIINVDYDTIKQSMVYPQDFRSFKHGFVWQTGDWSSDEINNDKHGDIGRYFELDPKIDKSLRDQMKDFAYLIYKYDQLELI